MGAQNRKEPSFEDCLPKLLNLQLFSEFKSDNEKDVKILKDVFDQLSVKYVNAGDTIIKEGDMGEDFFILMKGSVKVLRDTMAGDRIALADLRDEMGIFFGEAALIGADKRSATVIATTDCRLCVISGKKFKEICDKEPVLGYRVMLCLANRMRATLNKTNNDMTTLYEALFDEIVN